MWIFILFFGSLVGECLAVCFIRPSPYGHVTIPSYMTAIPASAFLSCSTLRYLFIGNNVRWINENAFRSCENLLYVSIGDSVKMIGEGAFQNSTKLQIVSFGDSVRSIGDRAFKNCHNLKAVSLGDSVTSIGDGAFENCYGLKVASLPNSVMSIGESAFHSCWSLHSVSIPGNVTSIRSKTFQNCFSLRYVYIPDSVTRIYPWAFEHCTALQSVSLGDKVTDIGRYAFHGCRSMQNVTIGHSNSIIIGEYAFFTCGNITSITFGTAQKVSLNTGAFLSLDKVEYLYFNKSMTSLSGSLPARLASYYHCNDDTCGCSKGYGNVHENTSSLYRCMPCMVGKTSGGVVSECKNCAVASYAKVNASEICTLCPKGKYGFMEGGTSEESACKNCTAGRFAQAHGSTTCFECPAGSSCKNERMHVYDRCLPGTYNSYPDQTGCLDCPVGRYQPEYGSAICEPCPNGTYLSFTKATSKYNCTACGFGTFGNSEGLKECHKCPEGQYQDTEKARSCKSCKVLGKTMTNNGDSTGCQVDEALEMKSEDLVVIMFKKGVALSTSFSISAAFVFICGLMQMKREGAKNDIAQLDRVQVFIKSALPGFSFGSEVILIFAMWVEAPKLARTMLAFRLLFPLVLIYILCAMFSSNGVKDTLTFYAPKAKLWGTYMHVEFAREIIPAVAVICILCMGDISLIQMLPWKKSTFYTESKGFPSMSLMLLCLSVKTLQSTASVICQISFLTEKNTLHNPTTSPQAKALFGLNIAVSIMTVIMGVLMVFLKNKLLKTVSRKSAQFGFTDNPLHIEEAVTHENENISAEALQKDNKVLKEENQKQRVQIMELKRTIDEGKSGVPRFSKTYGNVTEEVLDPSHASFSGVNPMQDSIPSADIKQETTPPISPKDVVDNML